MTILLHIKKNKFWNGGDLRVEGHEWKNISLKIPSEQTNEDLKDHAVWAPTPSDPS